MPDVICFKLVSLADVKICLCTSFLSGHNQNVCQIVFYFQPRQTELLLSVASETWYDDDARGEFVKQDVKGKVGQRGDDVLQQAESSLLC